MHSDDRVTWRELISARMSGDDLHPTTGDTWADVIACTLTEAQLDEKFCDGYGSSNGAPFTLWTKKYVYFPVVYDGAEWVGAVRRDPCDEGSPHWGGQ